MPEARAADITNTLQGLDVVARDMVRRDVDTVVNDTYGIIDAYQKQADALAASVALKAARIVAEMQIEAQTRVLLALFHASPGLIAILAAVWAAVKVVWNVVKVILEYVQLAKELGVHDLLYRVWDDYAEVIDTINKKISEASEVLGWGVDGISHLVNATRGGLNIASKFGNHSDEHLEWKFLERTGSAADWLATQLTYIGDDPGNILDIVFQQLNKGNADDVHHWLGEWEPKVTRVVRTADILFQETGTIIDELEALQDGMPAIVYKHIPRAIWDGLARADTLINETILPTLNKAANTLETLNKTLDAHDGKLSELAQRLTRPGLIFAELDEKPDYVRHYDEAIIDDVSNRQYDRDVDAALADIQTDLDEFDRVTQAMTAPTPEPEFLTIESPGARLGYTLEIEPHETWMVGGYDSPY